jgi:hypothetical protein
MLIINNQTMNIYNLNFKYSPGSIIYNRELYITKPQGSSIKKPGSKYSPGTIIYNQSLFETGVTDLLASKSAATQGLHPPATLLCHTMLAIGATDPADLVAQAWAETDLSRQLQQTCRLLPHPSKGGSSSYSV